jgi:hypothetical protein
MSMSNCSPNNSPEGAGPPLSDALDKWGQEAGAAGPPSYISELRLGQDERLALLFTTSVAEAYIHYVDWPEVRGYVRCPGPSCLLCQIGRHRERRDLLPVFEPIGGLVSVLAVSPTVRPQSLRAQLLPLLREVREGTPVLVGLHRPDMGRYTVTRLELPKDADNGAQQTLRFTQRLQAGDINLADIYPVIPDDTLAGISSVAAAMQLKGISL